MSTKLIEICLGAAHLESETQDYKRTVIQFYCSRMPFVYLFFTFKASLKVLFQGTLKRVSSYQIIITLKKNKSYKILILTKAVH